MSRPGTFNLEMYRGDTYAWRFTLYPSGLTTPVDLTGVTVKAEIRSAPGGTVYATMPCTVTLPNIIDMRFDVEMWEAWTARNAVWDMQLTYAGGEVATIIAGTVTVTPDVTDSSSISVAAGNGRLRMSQPARVVAV
jgi:hypothetical protein